jgi:site-specific DNA recombinase
VAQQITAIGLPDDGKSRRYALTGLLVCEVCGRRLDGHWVHGNPGYRCRHGSSSAHRAGERPRWVYWSQARLFRTLRDAHRDFALLGNAEDLAARLRAGDLVVICGAGTLTIDAAANVEDESEPVMDEQEDDHPQQLPLPWRTPVVPADRSKRQSGSRGKIRKQKPARHHVKRE